MVVGILKILREKSDREYANVAGRMRTAMQIADAMKELGMSKKQLAQKMGKHPSQITSWLSGTHNFSASELRELQHYLGNAPLSLLIEV